MPGPGVGGRVGGLGGGGVGDRFKEHADFAKYCKLILNCVPSLFPVFEILISGFENLVFGNQNIYSEVFDLKIKFPFHWYIYIIVTTIKYEHTSI